ALPHRYPAHLSGWMSVVHTMGLVVWETRRRRRRHEEVSTVASSARPWGIGATGAPCTGTGCANWCFRSSVLSQGRKARRSGGGLPPWSTQAAKKGRGERAGL